MSTAPGSGQRGEPWVLHHRRPHQRSKRQDPVPDVQDVDEVPHLVPTGEDEDLLEQLKRRGRSRPEDVARLDLATPFELVWVKETWLRALEDAEAFVVSRPADETGWLCTTRPQTGDSRTPPAAVIWRAQGPVRHYGRSGGILPRPTDQRIADAQGCAASILLFIAAGLLVALRLPRSESLACWTSWT